MKKLENVLVVMDKPKHRQTAFKRGLQLARDTGAKLHLVAFCHHQMYEQKEVFDTHQRNELKRALEVARSDWLLGQVTDAGAAGMEVTTEVVWEKHIHEWLIRHTNEVDYDLVVKTAHRSKTLVHTPTDWHLLRDCRSDVLLATKTRWPKRSNLIAAVDALRTDRTHKRLNQRVLEAAGMIAGLHDAAVHLVFAVTTPEVLSDLDIVHPREHRKKVLARAQPQLDAMAAANGIPAKRVHTPNGKPGQAVNSVAGKIKAEMVVLGTPARKGVAGFLLGNTAEKVLAKANCDILAVKP